VLVYDLYKVQFVRYGEERSGLSILERFQLTEEEIKVAEENGWGDVNERRI
jgi:hypothetical protein